MKSLYELTGLYQQLLGKLNDAFANAEDDDEFAVDDAELTALRKELLDMQDDREKKLEAYCMMTRNMQAETTAIDTEIKRLARRKRAANKKIDVLKDVMYTDLKASKTKKMKGTLFTIWRQKNPEKVEIDDADLVPTRFDAPQNRQLDTSKIKQALKLKQDIPGCRLTQSEGIRFR